MSTTPWQIRHSKRKTPSTVPAARKRLRFTDDADDISSKDQSTLTQFQFIQTPPPSFKDDTSSKRSRGREHGARRSMSRSGGSRKPRSTLTQMDWLNRGPDLADDLDDGLQPIQLDDLRSSSPVPNLDGSTEKAIEAHGREKKSGSGNKTRRRGMKVHEDSKDGGQQSRNDYLEVSEGSCELKDRSRRSSRTTTSHDSVATSGNQTRITKKVVPTSPDLRRTSGRSRPYTGLEIQDSVESNDETRTDHDADGHRVFKPRTPQKNLTREIPSSQTPQSKHTARYHTRFRDQPSPSATVRRKPLQPLSTNVSRHTTPRTKRMKSTTKSPNTTFDERLRRAKIVSLKPVRKSQIEDSQDEPTSFEEISVSSRPQLKSSSSADAKRSSDDGTAVVEIPPSSQYEDPPPMPSSPPIKDELPSLKDISSDHWPEPAASNIKICTEQPKGSESEDTVLLERPLDDNGPASPRAEDDHQSDSDLGSPVANDTQFNNVLAQRTSSPLPHLQGNMLRNLDFGSDYSSVPTVRLSDNKQHSDASENIKEDHNHQNHRSPAIPTPRLVRFTDASKKFSDEVSDEQDRITTALGVIRRVPPNDVTQSSQSSASRLQSNLTTQQSVHPASLPHPSQISTQYPTQGLMSSPILRSLSDAELDDTEVELFTIKDSSSIDYRMSQVPEYRGHSYSTATNREQIDDSEEEIDDLDIDIKGRSRTSIVAEEKTAEGTANATAQTSLKHSRPRKATRSNQLTLEDNLQEQDKSTITSRRRLRSRKTDRSPNQRSPTSTQKSQQLQQDSLLALIDDLPSSPPIVLQNYTREPIPGFDNDTQSDTTPSGHITAAYIHKQRERGLIPEWFTPKPYQLEKYRDESSKEKGRAR